MPTARSIPIIAQLEQAAGIQPYDAIHAKLEKITSVFAPTTASTADIQLLAELLSIPTDDRYAPLALTPQLFKKRIFQTVLRYLEMLTRRSPVLILFEDAHWSDPSSRDLLDAMVELAKHLPALLIITSRPEFRPPWNDQSHIITLTLSRFEGREGAELIRLVAGDSALAREVIEEIIGRTDGVPLFIEEVTKAVLEASTPDDAPGVIAEPLRRGTVPATLQASLIARFDRFGPCVKEIAQIGAAIGRDFSYDVLAAVAQNPEVELLFALETLTSAGLVFRRGTAPKTIFQFKHALVQDAAYSCLLRSRRGQLHHRIATVLEARFPDIVSSHPELIADHCARSGTPEKAIDYWLVAARHAIARSAIPEAVRQLQKGLALVLSLPDNASRDQKELNLQISLGQAQIASKGYAAPQATEAYARGRQLCMRLGGPPQLVSVIDGQWSIATLRGDLTCAQHLAKELLEFGEARSDGIGIVMGCQDSADTSLLLGDYTAARAYSERGLALYVSMPRSSFASIALEDPQVLMLSNLAVALLYLGHIDQARQRIEAAQTEARRLMQPLTLGWALFFSIRFHLAIQDYDAALQLSDDLFARIERHGISSFWPSANIFRGQCLSALGQPLEGLKLIEQGLAAHDASGIKMNLPTHLISLAQAYRRAAQVTAGLQELARATEHTAVTGERFNEPEMHRVRGELLSAMHDTAGAEASFRQAIAIARSRNARLLELIAAVGLARLWCDEVKRTEARDLLAPVYNWFTEGFDTPVLQEAQTILEQLRA